MNNLWKSFVLDSRNFFFGKINFDIFFVFISILFFFKHLYKF